MPSCIKTFYIVQFFLDMFWLQSAFYVLISCLFVAGLRWSWCISCASGCRGKYYLGFLRIMTVEPCFCLFCLVSSPKDVLSFDSGANPYVQAIIEFSWSSPVNFNLQCLVYSAATSHFMVAHDSEHQKVGGRKTLWSLKIAETCFM